MKQVLDENERKSIRNDLYGTKAAEKPDFNDRKLKYFGERTIGQEVLDLGCVDHNPENWKSKYWLHKAIKAKAKSIIGLDYYEPGVSFLNELGFSVTYGDAQNFVTEKKYDVVTAGDLIEHIPNLDGFFKSVRDALVDGGLFVLSTPNPWCWKYVMYHLLKGQLKPMNKEHVAWICLQQFENLGRRYGFVIKDFDYCSRRRFEKLAPLPARVKHTTLNITLQKV